MSRLSETISNCRSCGARALRPFLDLGITPLSDGLRSAEDLDRPEPTFPLVTALCENCALVQITETVDPSLLFTGDYPYYSSFSDAFVAHAAANAEDLIQRRSLSEKSLVVELASNDGYLLENFVKASIPVLGIDPAPGPVAVALEKGVETLEEFFTEELAVKLFDQGRQADVILGNNVLAHVADTNGFVAGIAQLLKSSGVGVFEFPYVRNLIDGLEFDTIYHEHLCYYSVTSVKRLFRQHGLFLNDVRTLPVHGGSLRIYVEKHEAPSAAVQELLNEEQALGLDTFGYYARFAERVAGLRTDLVERLRGMKADGKSIAAYGAAAKGSTLLNFFGIGKETLDFVVDRNVHKHGRFMPGVHVPIRPTKALLEEQPDCVLLLTWNFRDEILAQQSEYRERGGTFLVPIPNLELI